MSDNRAEMLRRRRFRRRHREVGESDRFGVAMRVAFGFGLALGLLIEFRILSEVWSEGYEYTVYYPLMGFAGGAMGGSVIGFIPGFLISLFWRETHWAQMVIGAGFGLLWLGFFR